jgi:hypothetical protein
MLATLKNSKQITILSIIFVGLMIPNVIVYVEHSILELDESQKSNDKGMANKTTRQLAEGVIFCNDSNWLYSYYNLNIC